MGYAPNNVVDPMPYIILKSSPFLRVGLTPSPVMVVVDGIGLPTFKYQYVDVS